MGAVKTEGQGTPQTDNGQSSSLDDDFARQLQLGMQDLLGEIQDSVCSLYVFKDRIPKAPVFLG